MLGLGIPVTVLGIEGLASKRNIGDAIYVTTGGRCSMRGACICCCLSEVPGSHRRSSTMRRR